MDLDNDGLLDLLVTSCLEGVVHEFMNEGDASFTHLTDYAVGGCPVFTKVVDMDDDLDRKLLISDFDGTITVLPASLFGTK